MSRVNFAWDEDEPHRVRTLNQRFNPDQVCMLISLIFPLKICLEASHIYIYSCNRFCSDKFSQIIVGRT